MPTNDEAGGGCAPGKEAGGRLVALEHGYAEVERFIATTLAGASTG